MEHKSFQDVIQFDDIDNADRSVVNGEQLLMFSNFLMH